MFCYKAIHIYHFRLTGTSADTCGATWEPNYHFQRYMIDGHVPTGVTKSDLAFSEATVLCVMSRLKNRSSFFSDC